MGLQGAKTFLVALCVLFSCVPGRALKMSLNLHSFSLKDMNGHDVSLSKYKGKAVLLLNVASL